MADGITALRASLAETHAALQQAEGHLHQLHTDGADHFRTQHLQELDMLTADGLDDWTQREWARSRVEERAGH